MASDTFCISFDEIQFQSTIALSVCRRTMTPEMKALVDRLGAGLDLIWSLGGGKVDMYFSATEVAILVEVLKTDIDENPNPGEPENIAKDIAQILASRDLLLVDINAKLKKAAGTPVPVWSFPRKKEKHNGNYLVRFVSNFHHAGTRRTSS